MYDRFLSMFNSNECMVILSVILFLIYYSIKNEKNTHLNKMIILTIIVMSSNISKELTILLCILFIYMTFNRNKNIENFNILNNNNLILDTNDGWSKQGIQDHINVSDDHFIGYVDRMFIEGRPQKIDDDGVETEFEINGWKDGICTGKKSTGFFANAAEIAGLADNQVQNRCTHSLRNSEGAIIENQIVDNMPNEELEIELDKVSKCAINLNLDGYDENAFAPCAAATGKHFKLSCKFTNTIEQNGSKGNYCYPNANMEKNNTGTPNNSPEDKILIRDKLLKGELGVNTEYVPITKYRLDENNEVKVLSDNSDNNSQQEFSHHNLDNIKQFYLTESTGVSGPRVESDNPVTGFSMGAGSDPVNNGFYYYKANEGSSRNNITDVPVIMPELNSNIRTHRLNTGYVYKYEFDKSNDSSVTVMNGNATWLPNDQSSMVNFDNRFDYRRIAVYIDNTNSEDIEQPQVRLSNKVFLGFLGDKFIDNVNNKVLDQEPIENIVTNQNPEINWLTFFSVEDQIVTMEENTYHPKFEGQTMKLELQDIREDLYLKYNPFDTNLKPGSEEHMNYTNIYFNEKSKWEDRTSKYIMRSIGCNRLRNPKLHSYGWWGKENINGKEIWKCKYENIKNY